MLRGAPADRGIVWTLTSGAADPQTAQRLDVEFTVMAGGRPGLDRIRSEIHAGNPCDR